MDRLPDIYDQGIADYKAGRILNPYKRGTPEGDAWDAGWWDAEAADHQGLGNG